MSLAFQSSFGPPLGHCLSSPVSGDLPSRLGPSHPGQSAAAPAAGCVAANGDPRTMADENPQASDMMSLPVWCKAVMRAWMLSDAKPLAWPTNLLLSPNGGPSGKRPRPGVCLTRFLASPHTNLKRRRGPSGPPSLALRLVCRWNRTKKLSVLGPYSQPVAHQHVMKHFPFPAIAFHSLHPCPAPTCGFQAMELDPQVRRVRWHRCGRHAAMPYPRLTREQQDYGRISTIGRDRGRRSDGGAVFATGRSWRT